MEADINGYFSIFWVDLNTQTRVDNVVLDNKRLIKVVDIFGRENTGTKNELLFYIYDDGTVEKRIVIE